MRRLLFLLTLFLAACGGDEIGFVASKDPAQHVPAILALSISPDSTDFMQGDGNVTVTADITFKDSGLDIVTLWIRLPDGRTISYDEVLDTETGTFTEAFMIPTDTVGIFSVDFWLVDRAGSESGHRTAVYEVGWTHRLGGLPDALEDVVWDGTVFVVVGDGGTVFTSVDGIDWEGQVSGTDVDLHALASHGSDIVALGYGIMLLSTDHGESWITKAMPDTYDLTAVAVSELLVVAGGYDPDALLPVIYYSEDRGDTWQLAEVPADLGFWVTDLIYRDGLFVAASDGAFSGGGARVGVSADGETWHAVILTHTGRGLFTVTHDGDQFIVAGGFGLAFTSFDAFNWTSIGKRVDMIDFWSAASDGSKLLLAGGPSGLCNMGACFGDPGNAFGMGTINGGQSWDPFNIHGDFLSSGMAFGNGLFVSVGRSDEGEGFIYTTE